MKETETKGRDCSVHCSNLLIRLLVEEESSVSVESRYQGLDPCGSSSVGERQDHSVRADNRANEVLGTVDLVLPAGDEEVKDTRVSRLRHVNLGSRDRLDHRIDLGLVDRRQLLLVDGDRLSVEERRSANDARKRKPGGSQPRPRRRRLSATVVTCMLHRLNTLF